MKRLLLTVAAAALLVTCIPHLGTASGPFDQKLHAVATEAWVRRFPPRDH